MLIISGGETMEISELPDVLLQRILLNLSTRDSVRTSVLSPRWRNLWKGVPGLHLIGDKYTNLDVIDFLERFLVFQKETPIHQFTLMIDDKDYKDVHEFSLKWLVEKVINRGVECFAINGPMYRTMNLPMYRTMNLPISLCKCETLVHLWLESVKFNDSDFFYLPRLETMHLESVLFSSEVVLEELILCSSVLQDLSIRDTTLGHLTLRSQTVKRLSLRRCFGHGLDSHVVIDTPSLEFLCIRDELLENFRLESASSSIKICIDVMSTMQAFHNFFSGISEAIDLVISRNTLEELYPDHCQPLQLPNIENLTHLKACFSSGFSEMLPMFLSSYPNLKSLELVLAGYPDMKKIACSPVPRCFQTSIEHVEVLMAREARQEISREAEIEFAKYILENAIVLKKLTLWLEGEEDESSSVLQRILTFPNRSLVEVKIKRSPPAKFRQGYGFEFRPVYDPRALFI